MRLLSIAEVLKSLLQREDGLCEWLKKALYACDKGVCVVTLSGVEVESTLDSTWHLQLFSCHPSTLISFTRMISHQGKLSWCITQNTFIILLWFPFLYLLYLKNALKWGHLTHLVVKSCQSLMDDIQSKWVNKTLFVEIHVNVPIVYAHNIYIPFAVYALMHLQKCGLQLLTHQIERKKGKKPFIKSCHNQIIPFD